MVRFLSAALLVCALFVASRALTAPRSASATMRARSLLKSQSRILARVGPHLFCKADSDNLDDGAGAAAAAADTETETETETNGVDIITDQALASSSSSSSSFSSSPPPLSVEETTKKYGLEVGMFKAMMNKDGSEVKPGELLKKYGAAYLITSITLAIISYSLCYFLVNAGVDVAALLKKVGIEVSAGATNAGTAGIAYVIHKAASPIRFPPTVALTPLVANALGREVQQDEK